MMRLSLALALAASAAATSASAALRRLDLTEYRSWSLTQPAASNAISYVQESNALFVRAGVPYAELILHASNGLSTNTSESRIKLVLSSAFGDTDCLPGAHEVLDIVWPNAPVPTALDGETSALSALDYQNSWANARFPLSGTFKMCYMDLSLGYWRLVPGQFTATGADTNSQMFFCLTDSDCFLQITGPVKVSWKLTVADPAVGCGVAFSGAFGLDVSEVSAEVGEEETRNVHSLGTQISSSATGYAVCYCTGYNADNTGQICEQPEDFVQLVGLLYTTQVMPKQTPHAQLRFDLQVLCGDGCPLTGLRVKLVDFSPDNGRAAFDPLSGCRTAQQAPSYMSPINCLSPTDCSLEPSLASASAPEWSNFRVFPTYENRAQKPATYDVCLCLSSCELASSWFKAGSFQTSVPQLRPAPFLANQVMDLQLYGANGGWGVGTAAAPELKILYDPNGDLQAAECFSRPQDLQSLAGHFCLSTTDCKAPDISDQDGHTWQKVRIFYAGMYAICYCEEQCHSAGQWGLLSWQLVAGPSHLHTWRRFRGLPFDLDVAGWGLSAQNRLKAVDASAACGAAFSQRLEIPDAAPEQLGNASGLQSIVSTYDGALVSCDTAHDLVVDDEVSLSGVASSCQFCAELLNSRPLRVIRVPASTQFVLQLSYETFPDFLMENASWARSSRVTFQDVVASSPGDYQICWSVAPSTSPEDFGASAGLLSVLEPPLFEAQVHNIATEAGVGAPAVVSFTTQSRAEYPEPKESRLRLRFPHLDLLSPVGPAGTAEEVTLPNARQSSCGRIIRELWSSDVDGFPMPKGCTFEKDGGVFHEYALIFGAGNGLKRATHYQLVLDVSASVTSAFPPNDGVLQLWSMGDNTDYFRVIEYAPAWLQRPVVAGASGTQPRLHSAGGVELVGADLLDLSAQGNTADIELRLRAEAGAEIQQGHQLQIFLWPLTQWHVSEFCSAACAAAPLNSCNSPGCSVLPFLSRNALLRLVFAEMDPISDTVQHTVRLIALQLPVSGFFGTRLGAELSGGDAPSFQISTGAVLFAAPSAAGTVLPLAQDKPFRGDQQNHLFVKLTLASALWGGAVAAAAVGAGSSVQSVLGLELQLPQGYACLGAEPAQSHELGEYGQGRGDIGLDAELDGYWLYSGRLCIYTLRPYGVVYGNSSLVVKLTVDNPGTTMPRTEPTNVWTIRLRGAYAPLTTTGVAVALQSGQLRTFEATAAGGRSNAPVLGVLTDASVSPESFGAAARNWLSVFFTVEQSAAHGAQLQLELAEGFLFQTQCLTQRLPSYHYASASAQLGLAPLLPVPVLRCRGQLHTALVTAPSSASLVAGQSYGFQIQVLNARTYQQQQHDAVRLTTLSATGDALDGSLETLRYVASDPEGPGASFGVYQLAMEPGSFVLSFDNMLPYSQTASPTRVVVFPLKVPFDSMEPLLWRLVAPLGYAWDFAPGDFLFRRQDILGVTADMPLLEAPSPTVTSVLLFESANFQGAWNRLQTYGCVARIRVPDSTPRRSSNRFLVEFGFDAQPAGRLAAASAEAPQVRAIVNFMVDYFLTSLAGKENVLQIQFQSVTALTLGGFLLIEAPAGFSVEASCAVQESPALDQSFQDLVTAGAVLRCSSEVPFATQRPQVTLVVVSGEVPAGAYSFRLDARNPLVPEQGGLVWSISSDAGGTPADMGATVEGFPVESAMAYGELLGADTVSFAATGRDDHPGQVTNVILAFELSSTPSFAGTAPLTVKAPPGFVFPTLCTFMVTGDVFGDALPFPATFSAFDALAVVSSCEGSSSRAVLVVAPGLRSGRRYVLRLGGVNPETTPEQWQNFWSISFGNQATEPFEGYRLWRFTEMAVAPSATARSTRAEETSNNVTIVFRTTNAVTLDGFLALQAPFGFRFPTTCAAAGSAESAAVAVACAGTAAPGNTARLTLELAALTKYTLAIQCANPISIAAEAGTWQLQSFSAKEAEYEKLLDLGQAEGFLLTEVFHTLKVIYPVTTVGDELELRMQILLYTAIERGDVLQITAPDGYDFTGNGTACATFRKYSAIEMPIPECATRAVRFTFLVQGLALVEAQGAVLTPLLDFAVGSRYPRKTLSAQATVFLGEQLRGAATVAAKTVSGQLVTPRLLDISVQRLDAKISVGSLSTLRLTFRVSQDADVLHITTVQDAARSELRFDFSRAQAVEPEVQVVRSNASLQLQMQLRQGLAYGVTIADVQNPSAPGTALWTLSTFVSAATEENQRDRSVNIAGPATLVRINVDDVHTNLADPFFDIVKTELSLGFWATGPLNAQYVSLAAPLGFAFLEQSFSPGEGFPLISGQVLLENEADRPSMTVQVLTPLAVGTTAKFTVRLQTPAAPEDLALWAQTHQSSWLLRSCRDLQCQDVAASNDDLFPGFQLKASFGAAQVLPEANGVAPQLRVTVTVTISPKASLSSNLQGGTVHLRIRAPLGFDFEASCLAVTPNTAFQRCEGAGRLAVLPAWDGQLGAGFTSVPLFVTNAAMTLGTNTWVLETFVDLNISEVQQADSALARQRSQVVGYEIRELLEAAVGGNTQRASVTTVFVWFLASRFLDVGGAVQLHAPPSYELRCYPRVQYISLPAGSCRLLAGVTSSTGDVYHQYLSLALTLPGQQLYPNTAYEFGVAAVNPSGASNPNYWGLVLLKPNNEVVDSTRTLPGYDLTDFQILIQTPLPTSTRPSVVNFVQLAMTFARQLDPGEAAHITILAPSSSKVLCQRFSDITGGGNLAAALPLDSTVGTYGTHSCQLQNSLTLHLDITRPVFVGTYVLQLGVLNPGMRAAKDFWGVELIKEVLNWRTAPAVLHVQVSGFGVSQPFVTEIEPVAGGGATSNSAFVTNLLMLLFVLITR
ncbi:unnamed protein product [Effrenium voratum]|nr:unnamed protein product [Effrenium voratum]